MCIGCGKKKYNEEGRDISRAAKVQAVRMSLDTFVKISFADTHNPNSKFTAGEMSVT